LTILQNRLDKRYPNVLVGLEYLKAGNDWTDQEMYEAFLYYKQVRFASRYDEFVKGDYELRTLYNFREILSRYMQETGINLLEKAFEKVTDQQIAAYQLKTEKQRMVSLQIASNIRATGHLQLLVEGMQCLYRMRIKDDQDHYIEEIKRYTQSQAG